MEVGDIIIWDSHFGYEIGIFIGDGVMYNTICFYVLTGRIRGKLSVADNEVIPFTRHNYYKVSKKYHNHRLPLSPKYKSDIRKKQFDIRLGSACDKYNL